MITLSVSIQYVQSLTPVHSWILLKKEALPTQGNLINI